MSALPAAGEEGPPTAEVFERYRLKTYHEASHKPYVIAAMILCSRFADPAGLLRDLAERGQPRVLG